MSILRHILTAVFFLLVGAAVMLFFSPQLPFGPSVEVKIVKSGSMEPTIMTGAAVVILERDQYAVGDVVTFTAVDSEIPTTHRIIGTEEQEGRLVFITKGDANEEADVAPVWPEYVIGKVVLDVPYLGFIFDFARQPLGFALLVGIPAFLIIFDEVEKIVREIRARRKPAPVADAATPLLVKELEEFRTSDGRFVAIAAISLGAVALAGLTLGGTLSFNRDAEGGYANTLVASAVDFLFSTPTIEITFLDGERVEALPSISVEPTAESSELQYDLTTEYVSGSVELCDGLSVSVATPFVYSGPLLSLTASALTLTAWELDISLAPETVYASGDTCVVDFVYTGWRTDVDPGAGYVDEERVRLTVSALVSAPLDEGGRVAPLLFLEAPVEETSELPPTPQDTEPTNGEETEDGQVTEFPVEAEAAPEEPTESGNEEPVSEPEPETVPEPEPEPTPQDAEMPVGE